MPLPDERPRQSVANLIGRFEQQTKRQSIGPTTAPLLQRAVSVSSQNTGDSAKEEVKEKKEWPPRTLKDEASSTPTPPAPVRQWSLKPTVSPAAAPKDDPIASSVSNPEAISVRIDPAPPDDVATTSAGKSPTSPSTSPKTRASAKLSSSKSAPLPRAPSTPAKKPTTKPLSPPSSLKSPPPAKPLRAQHTGQSTTSNTSTARVRTQSMRSASATPSHPKTANATPGAARPKTPSSTSRPKTPSSGLYAPTAASLAKARDAAPPLPTPSRRTSMVSPSAVIDRLSKPTAASASKARTPVVTASPPLARAASTKSSARGGAPAKAAVKPRVGLAPARMKEEKERKERASAAAKGVAGASAAVGGAVGAVAASQHTNGETVRNGVDEHVEELSGSASHDGTFGEGSVEPNGPQSHETEDGGGEADAEIESYDEDFVDETLNHDEIHHGLVDAGLAAPASSEPHPEDDAAELHMSVPATHAVVAEPEELEHEAHTEDTDHAHDAPAAEEEVPTNPEHEATYSAEAEADLEEGETTPQQEESRQVVPEASADLHHSADIVTPEPAAAEGTNAVDEPSAKAASGEDDIEDIVKMLESTSVVRRSPSIASIPDEESEE